MKALAVGLGVFVVLFVAVNITLNLVGPKPTPEQGIGWAQWFVIISAWVLSGYAAARISPTPMRTSMLLGGVIAALFVVLSVAIFHAKLTEPLLFGGVVISSLAFCSLGGIIASHSRK